MTIGNIILIFLKNKLFSVQETKKQEKQEIMGDD